MSMKYNVFIVLPLVIFIHTGCNKTDKNEVRPVYQDIREWVFAPGQLEWDDSYNLTAQSEGILTEADFEIGTVFQTGQIIATIDNPASKVNTSTAREQLKIAEENTGKNAPALQQLRQNISFAEEKLRQTQQQSERYERLLKNESISRLEYENVLLDYKNALANVNALKKQYDVLFQQAEQQKINIAGQYKNNSIAESYNSIRVLRPGKVIQKLKSTGDFVRKGDVVAVVANPSKIKITLTVDEKNIQQLKKGQEVKLQLNTAKDRVLYGQVDEILSAFDDKSQSFFCKILLRDTIPASLNIYGTPLEANILTGEKKNTLLIPRHYMGYGNKVMIKGMDSTTIIRTGIVSTDYVEVLEGLTSDDILLPIKQ